MSGKPARQRLWHTVAASLLALPLLAQAAEVLTVGVAENDYAPSLIFQRSPQLQLSGGLWKDLLDAVAKEAGHEIRYLPLARKRMDNALEKGQIDMVCNTHPNWWEKPSLFYWSQPITEQVERLISPASFGKDITRLSQMNGLRIGTVIGYHYPALAEAFENGSRRIDQQQGNLQLRAVANGVVDVAVIDELSLGWWQKNNVPEVRHVMLHPLVLSRMPLNCALSRRSSLSLPELDRAINALHKNGTITAKRKPYLPQ